MRTVLDEGDCFGRQLQLSGQQHRMALKFALAECHGDEASGPQTGQTPPAPGCQRVVLESACTEIKSSGDQQRRVGLFQARAGQLVPPESLKRPTARTYPNNTLVEDLSKCHGNLWPKAARATSRTIELVKFCVPPRQRLVACAQDRPGQAERERLEEGCAGFDANCDSNAERRADRKTAPGTKFALADKRAFRRYKFHIPESILRLNSTLTQDDYNRALNVLTGDVRFQLHILLYRRLQTLWTLFSTIICILIPSLIVTNLETFVILGVISLWLLLQVFGLLLTACLQKKLDQMLERAVAQVNSYFMDHNLMLGVINVGSLLTRSRLVIPVLYFNTFQCVEQIESIVSAAPPVAGANGATPDKDQPRGRANAVLDCSSRVEPKQKAFAKSQLAKSIVLRFSQRWISHFDKRKLMFTDDRTEARHLSTGKCLCQFIEEQLDGQVSADTVDECRSLVEPTSDDIKCAERLAKIDALSLAEKVVCGSSTDGNISEPGEGGSLTLSPDVNQTEATLSARSITPLAHSNRYGNIFDQCDLFLPSLSHMVSLRDRKAESARQDIADNFEQLAGSYPSKLIEGFASHLQQERADSRTSPTTELSSELDVDSLPYRNDELIRKLKLLLEFRSSEFSKNLDGSLLAPDTQTTSQANNKATFISRSANNRMIICDNHDQDQMRNLSNKSTSSELTIHHGEANESNQTSPISLISKKFFNQADGLFFLGVRRGQQGVYAKQQQRMLEIC